MMLSLYIHFPFCKRKCFYCDFCSSPASEDIVEAYCLAVTQEARRWAKQFANAQVDTVYLGGGTPSLVPAAIMAQTLDAVRACFHLTPDAEFTAEANPGALDARWLEAAMRRGLNRLSLGVQAAQDGLLRSLGRIHTFSQAQEAVGLARACGIANLNADVMFGLPGQRLKDYRETLERVTDLGVEHLSAYGLILEEGTPLERMVRAGERTLPDPDETDDMYQQGVELLSAAGYERYEISNFAKPGFACRHNLGYWQGKAYLGLGAAAHSHWPGPQGPVRRENAPDVDAYIRALRSGAAAPGAETVVGPEEAMFETLMLGLRTAQGVSERDFEARHGVALRRRYGEALEGPARDGLGRFEGPMQEGRFALTERGLALQNLVLLRLMDY